MRQGVAEIRAGNRTAAHKYFLQVARKKPQYVSGWVYAAYTAKNAKLSEKYLRQAESIDPNHPVVGKGWDWLKTRSKTQILKKPENTAWVSRSISDLNSNSPNWKLIVGGTVLAIIGIVASFFIFVMAVFYYLNVLKPGVPQVSLMQESPAGTEATETVTMTFNIQPTLSTTPTVRPSATQTKMPTRTPTSIATSSATVTLAAGQGTESIFPYVSYIDFYSAPERYAGQSLRLTGKIVGFGEASLNDKMVFALLLGPPSDALAGEDLIFTPVIILGIQPDAAFSLETILTVFGAGSQKVENLVVQGISWEGGVVIGEKVEISE